MASSTHHEPCPDHEVKEEPERMVLIGADRAAFLEAVLHPPEPTEKLVAALNRHRIALG